MNKMSLIAAAGIALVIVGLSTRAGARLVFDIQGLQAPINEIVGSPGDTVTIPIPCLAVLFPCQIEATMSLSNNHNR